MDNYYHTPQFRRALQEYENLRDKGFGSYLDAEELTDVAEYYQTQGKTKQALQALDMALKIFPGATSPTTLKARIILLMEQNPEKATEIVEQTADKSDVEYAYTKAEIMIVNRQVKAAHKYLQKRLNTFGGDEEDFILDAASLFADYDEHDYAEKWLQRSTLTDDDDYKEIQARIMMSRGMFDESERIFNELIDRDPFSNTYWNQLASSQYMRNNIKDSITSSEYALAINPDDEEAILNKANGLFTLGNLDEARNYYERFLKKQPNNGAVLQEMAFLLSRLGKTEEAMTYIDKAEQAGIDKDLANVTRGYVLLESNKGEQAGEFFQKAIRQSHSAPKVIFHIGIAVYDLGYLNFAKKMLQVLFGHVGPEWKDGYAYYARCCYELGDEVEFLDALKDAIRINPDEARQVLGDLYPEETDPKDYGLPNPDLN